MKLSGKTLNSALTLLSLGGGYGMMSPDRLYNADWIFFVCSLLLGPIAVLGIVAYAVFGARCKTLRRPSWHRFSVDWWNDPLQCLHVSIACMSAFVLGALVHLPFYTAAAAWTFASLVAFLVGIVAGRFLAHAMFRHRIQRD